ncbi:hypothetical protein J6590_059636, partial [Homalodisca vitripennis]
SQPAAAGLRQHSIHTVITIYYAAAVLPSTNRDTIPPPRRVTTCRCRTASTFHTHRDNNLLRSSCASVNKPRYNSTAASCHNLPLPDCQLCFRQQTEIQFHRRVGSQPAAAGLRQHSIHTVITIHYAAAVLPSTNRDTIPPPRRVTTCRCRTASTFHTHRDNNLLRSSCASVNKPRYNSTAAPRSTMGNERKSVREREEKSINHPINNVPIFPTLRQCRRLSMIEAECEFHRQFPYWPWIMDGWDFLLRREHQTVQARSYM